ncbi:hypothetical protein BCR43DRAFT_479100 [Syncephalastrum racemosum]|uniref:SEN1 N terminal-domain-containing protein n=1 Tax=Syncephalastrum racemosum TaxID=13706 RepID=A0A1X2H2Q6_SYNRA|nr:hypothetical protein BCR43DRAFT_479100 [Syncephalastrum racemosum]
MSTLAGTDGIASVSVLHRLLKEKHDNPGDVDAESQFYNKTLEYLMSRQANPHWWCSEDLRLIVLETLWLFSLPPHESIDRYKQALADQLNSCSACIQKYYKSKGTLRQRYQKVHDPNVLDDFFGKLDAFDTQRVSTSLQKAIDATRLVMNEEIKGIVTSVTLDLRIMRSALCDRPICQLFEKMQTNAAFPTVSPDCISGLVFCSFHHHRIIRMWARKMLNTFEKDHVVLGELDDELRLVPKRISGDLQDDMMVQDRGERWKALHLTLKLLPAELVQILFNESSVSSPSLIMKQLASTSVPWFNEILRVLPVLFDRLGRSFWAQEYADDAYERLSNQIFKHPCFLEACKIARADVCNTIQLRDGTPYPPDKLAVRVKGTLDWTLPFWKSLPANASKDRILNQFMDTLLGYFQLDHWSLMGKASAAGLGCEILLTTPEMPDLRQDHVKTLLLFACMHPTQLPLPLQGTPALAVRVLQVVLPRAASKLQANVLLAVSQAEPDQKPFVPSVFWRNLADICKNHTLASQCSMPVLRAYCQIATVDVPVLDIVAQTTPLMQDIELLRESVQAALKSTLSETWDERHQTVFHADNLRAILQLLVSPHAGMRAAAKQLMTPPGARFSDNVFVHIFNESMLAAFEGFIAVLSDFNTISIPIASLDVFQFVEPLSQSLLNVADYIGSTREQKLRRLVVNDGGETDSFVVRRFWDEVWRTMNLMFSYGLKWAETHKPKQVVKSMIEVMSVALQIVQIHPALEKLLDDDASDNPIDGGLSFVQMNESVDSLSHWAYVTRTDLLEKLVPLTTMILQQLHSQRLKISLEAYDRLMTAATGSNTTRLSESEKEELFIALSAHEPNNAVFVDDFDDDDIAWDDVPMPEVASPAATTTTTSATSSTAADFAAIIDAPDEFDVPGFEDLDLSGVTDDWLEGKVQGDDMQVDSPPPSERNVPVRTTTAQTAKPTTAAVTTTAKPSVPTRIFPPGTLRPSRVAPSGFTPNQRGARPAVYAVTSTGRRLKQPSMGFSSKMRNLREEFRAERRLVEASRAPSARRRVTSDSGSSSDSSSSDEEDGGKRGLLSLVEDTPMTMPAEKPKRSTILIETPATSLYFQKRQKLQEATMQRRKIRPSIHPFLKTLLDWDILKGGEIPPKSYMSRYRTLPDAYASYQEYLDVFEPLHALEFWEHIQAARRSAALEDVVSQCEVETRSHIDEFVDLTFKLAPSAASGFGSGDLVCVGRRFGNQFFRSKFDTFGDERKEEYFLGKVMHLNQRKGGSSMTLRCYFGRDRILLLNTLTPKSRWCILRLTSILTEEREYAALRGLEYYTLSKEILDPPPTPAITASEALINECIRKYKVNRPQAYAIVGTHKKTHGFTLIQGPPGTGKTKTILALIISLLNESHEVRRRQQGGGTSIGPESYGGRSKLLVCAPSNAAVDEIAKRLKQGVSLASGIAKPKVVRIGNPETTNTSVQDLLIDRLVEQELASMDDNNENDTDFREKREKLLGEISAIRLQLDEIERTLNDTSKADMTHRDHILRRQALTASLQQKRSLLKTISDDQRMHVRQVEAVKMRSRQKVLNEADVICATLSGAGHEMLTSMDLTFSAVIVDEAAQAVEVSALIPLKYNCSRCVLVGDPKQLPPTVTSLTASKYNYEQSLFMRLQKAAPDSVHLLSIQYRMHPTISELPSNLFYQGRLSDGPDMAKVSRAVWHADPTFGPYRFFNVEGQEKQSHSMSMYNSAEALAALHLVDRLVRSNGKVKFASRIGVITPYKQQLSHLKLTFSRHYGPGVLKVIDFNTVDGFQGQEKDIIIFSCVRAFAGHGSIGFLADQRRMNVGLTRARCSLFVLGHEPSLRTNSYWDYLIQDAHQRHVVSKVSKPYFDHLLEKGSSPPNLFESERHTPAHRHYEHAIDIRPPKRRFEDEPPARPASRPRVEPRPSPHARVKREEEALASVQTILKSSHLPPSSTSAPTDSRRPKDHAQTSSPSPPSPRPPATPQARSRAPPRKKMNLQEYRAKFGTPKGSSQQHASNLFIPRKPKNPSSGTKILPPSVQED